MRSRNHYLLHGVRTAWGIAASIALLAVYLAVALRSAELDADWGIDEGQRIAEAYFWRLVRVGDFANGDWFDAIAVRSHPPLNKYFFGAAIELAGVGPPRSLELVGAYDAGAPSASMPPAFAREYGPMRRPARIAALAANIAGAVIVFAVVLRGYGVVLAALSQLLLFRHFLFRELLFRARSDALEAFLATATLVPLLVFAATRRPAVRVAMAVVAGIVAALDFQTRLNGGVALVMCIAFMVALAPRARSSWIAVAVTVAVFALTAVAVNPFYWAPHAASAPLPLRVVERFSMQIRDLRALLAGVEPQWHLTSPPSRLWYSASILFSGKAGGALCLGLLLSVAALVRGRATGAERAIIWWAMSGGVVTALWIPLRWEPYLLIALPPLVLAALVGYGAVQRWIWDSRRERSLVEQRTSSP